MTRLSGLDANFLYWETPRTPMHTLKIAVVDTLGLSRGEMRARFVCALQERLAVLPTFRARIHSVPLGLHHPVWAEDPDFDVQRHVYEDRLPQPGTAVEMDEAIGRIAAGPLPRDRPLWAVWILHGLQDGAAAIVFKLHHALADGAACLELMNTALSGAAASSPLEEGRERPRPTSLMRAALRERPSQIAALPRLARDTLQSSLTMAEHRRSAVSAGFKAPFTGPTTVFNRALCAGRQFATARVSLDDMRRIKSRLGVTLNDVVMGVAGGAVRTYLAQAEALPDKALVAAVPVARPRREATQLGGNNLSNLMLSLFTDQEDHEGRIGAIHRANRQAKESHALLGSDRMRDWAEYAPPRLMAATMRLYSRLRLADRHRPPVNLVVSNVRGPAARLWAGAHEVRSLYSVGPILDGIGLNITVWSYAGEMAFSVLGHDQMPLGLRRLTDAIPRVVEELSEPSLLARAC